MIEWFDYTILEWFRSMQNPAATMIFKIITTLGEAGIIWIAIALLFLARKKTRAIGSSMLLALVFSFVVGNAALKNIVARPRPCWREEVEMFINMPKDYSFPSGHTMSSFASVAAVFMWNKKIGAILLLLAVPMALSRLYFYVHYPTDIVAGIVFGILVGCLAGYIVKKYCKKQYNLR